MCHYCGCRDMPLLRDYIAEHERAVNLGGAAVRALDRGEQDKARALLASMAEELDSHWRGEEDGLFAVMADELSPSTSSLWCASTVTWQPCSSPSTCPTRRTGIAYGTPLTTFTGTSPRRRTGCSPRH